MTTHGHIRRKVRRSTFDSSPNKDPRKPAYFAPWYGIAFNLYERLSRNVTASSCKNCRHDEGAMGSAKTYRRQ
jgi:hypothetical protein